MTRRHYDHPATWAELLDLARWPIIIGLLVFAALLAWAALTGHLAFT